VNQFAQSECAEPEGSDVRNNALPGAGFHETNSFQSVFAFLIKPQALTPRKVEAGQV
jgi:hypothetical protein